MRRGELRARLRVAQYETLAIGNPGIEAHRRRGKARIDGVNQFAGLGGGDLAGAVIDHDGRFERLRLRQRNEVAAVRHVRGVQFDADARGFKRRAAGIIDLGIVAEHREVGGVAAGAHAFRDGAHHPEQAVARHAIHSRMLRHVERRFPVQLRHRHVRHAVAEEYDILHSFWGSFPEHSLVRSAYRYRQQVMPPLLSLRRWTARLPYTRSKS